MRRSSQPVKSTSTANIAFSVVVLAAYFATFSAIKDISLVNLLFLVAFGIAYISIGIYGFSFVAISDIFLPRIIYLIIQMILGGLINWLGKGEGFSALILLPLAGQAVVLLAEAWAYLASLVIVAVYIVSTGGVFADRLQIWTDLPIFLAGLVFIVVFTQVAVGEERSRAEVERLNHELTQVNTQLREYSMQVEELAIAKERNRVAREIHDGLGHYLTTIHMEIQAANAVLSIDPMKASELLEKAQALTQDALVDVRASVTSLRLSPEAELPLKQVVERLFLNCESIGIKARLIVTGEPRSIQPIAQQTLYRVAQESINNICKHSKAKNMQVSIDYEQPEWIVLAVKDDGVGASQLDGGFGLIGLRERVNLLHGDIKTLSTEGEGFLVEVRIPG